MLALFNTTAFKCSKLITQHYSTSFSLGIRTLHQKLHAPIYAIYGFVRYADEIVDTFYDYDQKTLFQQFEDETWRAITEGISMNPILQAFQLTVRKYQIEDELIEAFLKSMEADLDLETCNSTDYQEYIYGSAEVVGLMCLRVFCEGDEVMYQKLKEPAQSLGSAFQKVNFLRDMKSDYYERGRVYFPNVQFSAFDRDAKTKIEADIQKDFDFAYQKGILELPRSARLGVYLAYIYYVKLFHKIRKSTPEKVLEARIRVPNARKLTLLAKTYIQHQLNFI